jgi:hemerythrin-like metal-binding protein
MAAQWTYDLATDIHEIDEQHRDLFANVAALRDSMRLGSVAGAARTINFLERYTIDHFATEERWMEQTGYPELAAHRAAHQALVAEFLRRKAAFTQSGATPSLVLDLSDWLGAWLHDHVNRADRAMARHLREKLPDKVTRASP